MLYTKLLRQPRQRPMAPPVELHYLDSAELLLRLQAQGYSRADMAGMTGLSMPQMMERVRLNELDEGLRAYLRREGVPERIAMILLRLPDEVSRRRLAHRIVAERLCIRDAGLLAASAQRRGARAAEEPVRARRVVTLIRDVRPYRNAIRDIAEQMKTAGVRATFSERRTGGMQELTVSWPARRRRTERYHAM